MPFRPLTCIFMLTLFLCSGIACAQNNRDSLFQTAIQLLYREDFRSARIPLLKILDQDEKDAGAIYELGMIATKLKEHAVAEDYFTRYLVLEPEAVDGYFLRGISRFHLGKSQEAISDFRKTIRLEPGNADAHYYLSLLYLNQEKPRKALCSIDKAIKADRERIYYHELRYELLGALKKSKKQQLEQQILIDLKKDADQ